MISNLWRTDWTQTNRHTETHIDTHTDRQKRKTERPKILSNDIFYFKTVIIGGYNKYAEKKVPMVLRNDVKKN